MATGTQGTEFTTGGDRPPLSWPQRVMLRWAPWQSHRGVRVAATVFRESLEARALAKVFSALDVLAEYAPGQLERLPRYMLGITVTPLITARGCWRADMQACLLDQEYVLADETTPEELACTIVHELMHARLRCAGFGYEEQARVRIEHICYRAERHLLERFPDSALRDGLNERLNSCLASPPEHWSDEAMVQRHRERHAGLPWWMRASGFVWDLVLRRVPPN